MKKVKHALFYIFLTLVSFSINELQGQCPTGTPIAYTCGTPYTTTANQASGLWGSVSTTEGSCNPSNNASYADIFEMTYTAGDVLEIDGTYMGYQNADFTVAILDAATAGCPEVGCEALSISGVGSIAASSFHQNPATGFNNSLVSLTVGLDDLGLTDGQTIYIKIHTDKKTVGGGADGSATGPYPYSINCANNPANSCENGSTMLGGNTYAIDNQYAADNSGNNDSESGTCGYSIENNLMYNWCTDAANSPVTLQLSNFTVIEPAAGSMQFAILSGACGGPYTTHQCNTSITADQDIAITGPVNPITASTCYWLMFDGNGGTMYTGDISLDGALPIVLKGFSSTKVKDGVRLYWKTMSELNNSHFILERSINGEDFDFVAKTKGSGNSVSPINYFFIDKDPIEGLSYYRLTQVDYDGTTETFPMIVNKNYYKGELLIFPNPIKDQKNISIKIDEGIRGDYLIEITNMYGNNVYSKSQFAANGTHQIEVPIEENLTRGVYWIKLINGHQILSSKMIVE